MAEVLKAVPKRPEFVHVASRGLTSNDVIRVKTDFNPRRKLKGAINAIIAQKRMGLLVGGKHVEQAADDNSEAEYQDRYQRFLADYPDYAKHADSLNEMRTKEYARLDDQEQIYVDYTGGSLYPSSLVEAHCKLLLEQVLGNPHSTNPTSHAATELVEATRQALLQYVNADPAEYTAVFTLNASGALKLVAEAFPFTEGSHFLLSTDNHNSVGGIREIAMRKGAEVMYAPLDPTNLRHDEEAWNDLIVNTKFKANTHNLFAFPGQSNFSGVKHPLSLANKAKEAGWTVLVDTAAFLPTNKLDLSECKADFATVSFYKIFGYPTGVGALIARKDSLEVLRQNRPWFSGGVVSVASVNPPVHVLAPYEAAFEEGTVAYTQIPAVAMGLNFIERVGIDVVNKRVTSLTGYFLNQLTALKHSNGKALVTVLGPSTTENRGGTVSIALWDSEGHWVHAIDVEALANAKNISLRIGCFCNPGAGETAFGLLGGDATNAVGDTYDEFGFGHLSQKFEKTKRGAFVQNKQMSKSFSSNKPSGGWMMSVLGCTSTSAAKAAYDPMEMKKNPSADMNTKLNYEHSDRPLPRLDFINTVMKKARDESNEERPIAAVRVSFGLASNFKDVDNLVLFVQRFVDR